MQMKLKNLNCVRYGTKETGQNFAMQRDYNPLAIYSSLPTKSANRRTPHPAM